MRTSSRKTKRLGNQQTLIETDPEPSYSHPGLQNSTRFEIIPSTNPNGYEPWYEKLCIVDSAPTLPSNDQPKRFRVELVSKPSSKKKKKLKLLGNRFNTFCAARHISVQNLRAWMAMKGLGKRGCVGENGELLYRHQVAGLHRW